MSTRMALFVVFTLGAALADLRRVDEPVRFVRLEKVDLPPHDGRLRPPVGVANYQVLRANRTRPDLVGRGSIRARHVVGGRTGR